MAAYWELFAEFKGQYEHHQRQGKASLEKFLTPLRSNDGLSEYLKEVKGPEVVSEEGRRRRSRVDVKEAGAMLSKGLSYGEVAEKFGVRPTAIYRLCPSKGMQRPAT